MVFVVTIGVLLVSYKISKFHELNLAFSCGEGSYVKQEGVEHCVICGNIKWEYLKAFIEEFYSDHDNFDTELVVMSPQDDWVHQQEQTKYLRKNSLFLKRVSFFNGACMIEEDLIRSKVRSARAVFVLSNQHNPNIYAEDSETLKRILTIRSHSPETPVFAMCALTDSMFQIGYALEHSGLNDSDDDSHSRGHSSDDDSDGMVATVFEGPSGPTSEAICMQDLEMSMLAANVYCNGMSTLLSNLLLFTVPTKDPADEEEPWLKEYKAGTENSFHIVKIPGVLDNTVYSEIALTFIDHGVVLLATKKFWSRKHGWEPVTPSTKLTHSSIGLVMTFMARIDLQTLIQNVADRWAADSTSSYQSESEDPGLTDSLTMRTPSWHEIAGRHLTGDGRMDYLDDHYNEGGEFQDLDDDDEVLNDAVESHNVGNNPFVSPPFGRQYTGTVDDESFDLPAAAYDQHPRSHSLDHFSRDIQETENEEETPLDSEIDYILDAEMVQPTTQRTVGWDVESRRPQSARPSTQNHVGWDASSSPKRSAMNRPPTHHTGGWHASTSPSRSVLRRGSKVAFGRDAPPAILSRSPTIASGFLGDRRPGPSLRPDGRSKSDQCITLVQRDDEPRPSTETADQNAPEVQPQVVEILPSIPMTLADYYENNEDKKEDPFDDGPTSKELRFHQRRQSGDKVLYPGMIGCGSLDDGGSLGKRSTNSFGTIENKIHVSYGDQPLPETFQKHVVVCVIGSMGMMNLKRFLHCLSAARRKQVQSMQVIAICPVVSEESIQELEELTADNISHDTKQIHISLIQGNSLSISTLKCAQCETASSIVVLACEDKNIASHIDSQTIYTVMSLDHLLEENANTFVCSMIDSEESLHLLRAPQKQRLRIGDLGALPGVSGLMRKKSFRSMRALGQFRSHYSMRSMQSERFSRGFSFYDLPRTASMAGSKLRQSRTFVVAPNNSEGPNRSASIGAGAALRARPSIAMDMNMHSYGGSASHQIERYQSFNAAPLLTRMSTVNRRSWMGGSSSFARTNTNIAGFNTDMGDNSGAGGRSQFIPKKSRDDAFEKERYASGELMISSMFIALLIREVSMPGLTSVVSTLFGTRLETQPCWVRSIPVPKHWMAVPEGEVVEYRDLCEKLLQHSCIPLGLYRCGAAPIRVFCPDDDEEGGIFDFMNEEVPSYRDNSMSNSVEEVEEGEKQDFILNSPMYPDRHLSPSPSQVRAMDGDKRGSEAGISMDGLRLGEEEYGMYQFVTSDRKAAYRVHSNGFNVLPYVYTNPEPYTVVSEHDAIFVLADPSLDLDDKLAVQS